MKLPDGQKEAFALNPAKHWRCWVDSGGKSRHSSTLRIAMGCGVSLPELVETLN